MMGLSGAWGVRQVELSRAWGVRQVELSGAWGVRQVELSRLRPFYPRILISCDAHYAQKAPGQRLWTMRHRVCGSGCMLPRGSNVWAAFTVNLFMESAGKSGFISSTRAAFRGRGTKECLGSSAQEKKPGTCRDKFNFRIKRSWRELSL